MVSKGNHPQMAARFRLKDYYNLPRYTVYLHSNPENNRKVTSFKHSDTLNLFCIFWDVIFTSVGFHYFDHIYILYV